MFRDIDAARKVGNSARAKELMDRVESYESHMVPIIADVDAGFSHAEAT